MNKPIMQNAPQDLAHLRPIQNDEIDLAELIRNLIKEWKLILSITVMGAFAGIIFALTQTPIYKVETTFAAPTISQLGKLTEQNIISLSREEALELVAEQLISATTQRQVFDNSELKQILTENSDGNASQLFTTVRQGINLKRIDQEFYTIQDNQVLDLKEINFSFETANPIEGTAFIQELGNGALKNALENVSNDISNIRAERIANIQKQLTALTESAKEARLAQIERIEDSNRVKIEAIELELQLLIAKATEERFRKITQLEEALETAKALNIINPVTWEDLRDKQPNAQVFNDLTSAEKNEPLYFRGSKYLTAEIDMLKKRTDDSLYIDKVPTLKMELATLKNDTALKALKERKNDTIYVEQFNNLQNKLAELNVLDSQFSASQLANVTQPAEIPVNPIKPNKKLIVLASTVLAGFLALFLALIRVAILPSNNETHTSNPV
jgi:LPS O-antigen subunit length determinant protein (WzzB/FepE family)